MFLNHFVDCLFAFSENLLLRHFVKMGFSDFQRRQDAFEGYTQTIKENVRSSDAQFYWTSAHALRIFLRNLHDVMIFVGGTSRKGNLRTLRTAEPGSGRPKCAETTFGHSLIGLPEIVTRQADVLPAERRDVLE
jgi:hypothetical protein